MDWYEAEDDLPIEDDDIAKLNQRKRRKVTVNQSALTEEHISYAKDALQENPELSWYKLGKQIYDKYGLQIHKASLRRLHSRLQQDAGVMPRRLPADELHAGYYEIASALLNEHPDFSWNRLRRKLERNENVTASDGVFKHFYSTLPGKSLPTMGLRDLRTNYTSIGLDIMRRANFVISWNTLKERLQKNHNITTHDSSARTFHKELMRFKEAQ